MLEKQFGFSSAETGLLMSCNDIGYLTCVIFAGYIARKVSTSWNKYHILRRSLLEMINDQKLVRSQRKSRK